MINCLHGLRLHLLWMALATQITSGQEIPTEKVFSGHLGAITMARYSGGGTTFVSASFDQTIGLWDLTSEKQVRSYTQHTAPVFCVDVSGDHRTLVSGAGDNTVRVWSLPHADPILWFEKEQPGGLPFATSTLADALVIPSSDKVLLHRSHLAQQPDQVPGQRKGHAQRVTSLVYRSDGAYFMSGDASGRICVWSPYIDSVQQEFSSTGTPVTALAFAPGNQQLYAAGAGGVVHVWQLTYTKPKPISIETTMSRWVITGGGARAVGVTSDQRLVTLDCATGKITKAITKLAFAPVALAVAPNETWAALVADAGTTHVVNLSDGAETGALSAEQGKTLDVAIHPDSKRFATCRPDGSIAIWPEPPTAEKPVEPVHTLQPEPASPAAAQSVLFSTDQQHVISGAADGRLRKWNIGDGKQVQVIEAHLGATSTGIPLSRITPNGQTLLTIGEDQTLRLWNAADGVSQHILEHPARIRDVAVSTDSTRAAALCEDGSIRLWELTTGELLQRIPGDSSAITQTVGFLNDGVTLVTTAGNGSFAAIKPSVVRVMRIDPETIRDMATVASGSQILTAGGDRRVVLTNGSNGSVVREYRVTTEAAEGEEPVVQQFEPTAVAARGDSQRMAAGTANGEVFVWNAGVPDQPLVTLKVESPVTSLAYSPDNQKLMVGTEAGVTVFGPSLPGVTPALELMEHQRVSTGSAVSEVQFAADNSALWISTVDGAIGKWGYAGIAQLRQMNHSGAVYGVALSDDGRTVVSCSADQTVRVWDTTTGQQKALLRGHTGPVHAVDLSADETFAVSSGADGTLQLWDIAGGRQLKQLVKLEATMYSLAIAPDGTRVAAAGADRKVYLFNMITGEQIAVLEGHPDYIHCVRFDAAGQRLLSYGYAGHLRIWNAADGKPIHQSRIGKIGNDAQFSADGKHILLSGGDGTSRIVAAP